MATLYGDVKTTKYHTGETHERAYITYSTSSIDTVFTISGTVYLRAKQYSWDYDVSPVYASLNSASITVSSGTVSKSGDGTSVHLTKLNTAYDKAGYTFTATINKTHSSQSITLSLSAVIGITYMSVPAASFTATSSGSVAISVPAKTSYVVQYNANSGSGAPSNQTKWHGETLTLSSAKPTKAGYTFKGWATSTTIAASGTVNKAPGATYSVNEALTLYAVWELTYSKPSITNLSVERCSPDPDNPGQYILDDEGRYAQVSFDWSVFRSALPRYHGGSTAPYSENTVDNGGCTVTVGAFSLTPTLSGASGTETVVVGDGSFDPDMQYSASVAITDTQIVVTSHTTTVTGTLAKSSFPLDFNADATAVGFFMPAPDNGSGMYVGGDIDITSGHAYKINGTALAASDVGAVPASYHKNDVGWTALPLSSSAVAYSSDQAPKYKRWGDMVHVYGAVSPKTTVAAGGSLTIGTLPSGCRPPRNNLTFLCQGSSTNEWMLGINSSGVVSAQRYRSGATNNQMVAPSGSSNGSWLTFSAMFLV